MEQPGDASHLWNVTDVFHLRRDFFHSRQQNLPFREPTENWPRGSGLLVAEAGLTEVGLPTDPASGASASRGSKGCWSVVDVGPGARALPAPPRPSVGPRFDRRRLRPAPRRACDRRAGIWTRSRRRGERPERPCCDGRAVSPDRYGRAPEADVSARGDGRPRSGRSGRSVLGGERPLSAPSRGPACAAFGCVLQDQAACDANGNGPLKLPMWERCVVSPPSAQW